MSVSERNVNDIKILYFFHRFLPASIAKLYGVSKPTITNIIEKNGTVAFTSDTECLLCGLTDVFYFYIDGNPKNKKPQNVLSLCEACKRRLQHMQMSKKQGILTSEF